MTVERDEDKAVAKLADDFVRGIKPFDTDDERMTFGFHPELGLDRTSRKMFYLADFVRRYFSGRHFKKDAYEGKKMHETFLEWKENKLKTTNLAINTSILHSIKLESIEGFAQKNKSTYMNAFDKLHGRDRFYSNQNEYWFRIHGIARHAVSYKKRRVDQARAA